MTFIKYFNNYVKKIKLVDRKKSKLMKLIAWILLLSDKLNITSIGDFLKN